jgi:hypothetical protein
MFLSSLLVNMLLVSPDLPGFLGDYRGEWLRAKDTDEKMEAGMPCFFVFVFAFN